MKIKVITCLITLFIITSSQLTAQQLNKAKMDSLFALIEANNKGMGSLSIFKDGEEVYRKSIGYANLTNKQPLNENTIFRIGSISKMYTATITMKLIEQEKLKLETKLSEFFPEVPNAENITIEHMLRHRSGIYNVTNAPEYFTYMTQSVSGKQMVEKIAKYESLFTPGEKAEYSNSNYLLLTYIAEKITGKKFPDLLQEYISKPHQLRYTKYGSKIDPKKNEALSYAKTSDWVPAPETHMSVPAGAGAIVSTPSDVNKFLHLLFNGKIVSPNSLELMMNIQDGFGLGMFEMPFHNQKTYGHGGGIDGFSTLAGYFPEEKVSIAYFSNGVMLPVNDIFVGAASIYFDLPYELPDFRDAITLKPEELDQYLGVYSSPTFPLKITISKNSNTLYGQATGQSAFPLEAYDTNKFRFEQAGIQIEFSPEAGKLILKQAGAMYELEKEG